MSDLILNVNFGLSEPSKKGAAGNQKHKNFLKRRRFLERKGVLKQKQLPPAQQQAAKGSRKKSGSWGRNAKKQRAADVAGRDQSKTYPKVNNPQPSPAAQNNSTGSKRTCFPKGTCASVKGKKSAPLLPAVPSKLVAIDCEMVGTGPGGRVSDLARCSIVSYDGDVVYDQYIRPANPIVDYRTRWSGIKRHHMANAVPFGKAQREILKILSGKIVVGHAICNDFKALKYFHPHSLTRDTSKIPLLNRKGGFPENVSISLKRLTKQLLRKDIQVPGGGGGCRARRCGVPARPALGRFLPAFASRHRGPLRSFCCSEKLPKLPGKLGSSAAVGGQDRACATGSSKSWGCHSRQGHDRSRE
uniref:Interferon stimulated exonuclease gene 20 like 2 n=1 Tax=Apteryx owenii TaxID=8824 RepID=A0A8B9Q5J5_APTOW